MAKPVISDTIAGMLNNAIAFDKCIVSIYENDLAIQLGEYFQNVFDQALSAFRAGCEMYSTLLCKLHVWRLVRYTIVPCTPLIQIN